MNDQTSVGKRLQNLEVGPEFNTYTRVIIHAGQTTDAQGNTTDRDYIAGNTTGRTMEITDPLGTQAKANALLTRLRTSNWQYQPYTADSALLDPAAELGDGVSVSDTFSAIYKRDVTFSSLMAADISAPSDEEIDHEYPYIPKTERVYKRETAYTRTQLKINENAITLEASTARANESSLSSRITVNAGNITAEASRAQTAEGTKLNHTNTSQAFGWSLTPDAFLLKNNNTTVFQFDANGLRFKSNGSDVFTVTRTGGLYVKGNGEFTGKITATSGYIGNGSSGFEIGNTYIRNGMTSISDTTNNGIYLGTNGIALGKGNFTVTNAGVVTAKSGTIGGISLSSSYGLYTNGKTSATSTATGFFISKNGAIYLGPYSSAANACTFQVTSSGVVTASNINITGGSMTIKSNGVKTFEVTSAGKVTASNLNITGGTISIKDNGTEKFKVTSTGAVTAANLTIKGGSIAIGSKFSVDTSGNVTATALTIRGGSINIGSRFSVDTSGNMTASNANLTGKITATGGKIANFTISGSAIHSYPVDSSGNFDWEHNAGVYIATNSICVGKRDPTLGHPFYVDVNGNMTVRNATIRGRLSAGDIWYGGNDGTFSGNGLTNSSITGSKIGIGEISGGTNSWGVASGHIAAGTVAYGNTGFTGTLDQVGINQSNIAALSADVASIRSGYFNSISTNSIAFQNYYFYVSNGDVRASPIG